MHAGTMWTRPATFAKTSFLPVSHMHDSYQEQSLLEQPLSHICLLSPGDKTHLGWIPRVLFLKEEEKLTFSVHNRDRSYCKDETWSSELSRNGGQTGRGACWQVWREGWLGPDTVCSHTLLLGTHLQLRLQQSSGGTKGADTW